MRSMLETSMGSGPTPRAIETPPGRKPLNVAAIVLPPEAVYQDDPGAAERLQCRRGVCGGAVNVVMGPEPL
jgi:hypothetical protein